MVYAIDESHILLVDPLPEILDLDVILFLSKGETQHHRVWDKQLHRSRT
jgi:hypothetical protein